MSDNLLSVSQQADIMDTVKQAVSENHSALAGVVNAAAEPALQQMADNSVLLGQVTSAATKAANKQVNGNTKQLNAVLSQLVNAAGAAVQANQQILGQLNTSGQGNPSQWNIMLNQATCVAYTLSPYSNDPAGLLQQATSKGDIVVWTGPNQPDSQQVTAYQTQCQQQKQNPQQPIGTPTQPPIGSPLDKCNAGFDPVLHDPTVLGPCMWACFQGPQGKYVGSLGYVPNLHIGDQHPANPDGSTIVYGPSTDFEAVFAFCNGPNVTPPQPPQPPIGTPPIGSPQCQVQYWCAHLPGKATQCYDSTQLLACMVLDKGPFSTLADCQAGCTECNAIATVQPPQPPTQTTTLNLLATPPQVEAVGCNLTPDGQLPAVGSPEWCGCLDAIISWAQQSTAWLSQALSTGSLGNLQSLLPDLPSLPLPFLGGGISIGPLMQSVLNAGGSAVSSAWNQLTSQVFALGSQVTILVSLDLLRAIVRFLERVRIGTDLAIWATGDLHIVLPWMERLIDYAQNYVWQIEPPSIGEAIECYLQHTADTGLVKCWMAMRGANLEAYAPVIDARRDKLFTQELLEWGRRHDYTDDQLAQLLNLRGWYRTDEAAARVELYDHLPTISDHLHWLQRNVFDDAYVTDYNLMEGFEERFWNKFGHDLRALGMKKEYAALHYAAHWINPAPGQLQEMVYRLNPDLPGVENPFTLNDYERILAEQDVAPYFRPRFAEIAYRVPALSYLRDMYRAFVITNEDMVLYHRKLGYTVEDSERFVAIDQVARERYNRRQGHGWTPDAIGRAYAVGLLSEDQVVELMTPLQYGDAAPNQLMQRSVADLNHSIYVRARSRAMFSVITQVGHGIEAGVFDQEQAEQALESIGWPADFSEGYASIQIQTEKIKLIKTATTRIKGAYLRGDVDELGAANALQALGVNSDRRNQYLTVWRIENTPHKRALTKAEIISDLASSLIDAANATYRLHNLGYNDADVAIYLATAQQRIDKRAATAAAAQARNTRANAKLLASLQKDAQKQADALIAKLKRAEPVSKLQKWAGLGIISQNYFFARMGLYGFSQTEADAYWNEAAAKKGSTLPRVSPTGQG